MGEAKMYGLAAQTALITGGAQGLGYGIALELSRAGSRVIVADKNFQQAKIAADEIKQKDYDAVALALDVRDSDSVRNCVETSIARFSRIDVLVNNAGVLTERPGIATTPEHFSENLDVNLVGIWRMTQALVPYFKAQGGGRIINIASTAGRTPYAETPAYCASKAAVINLTRSLAAKLGADNINVNAICPGAVKTEMTMAYRRQMPNVAEAEEALLLAGALKRELQPEDIGWAVVFFAAPQSRNITGQSLNVDLGFMMS